MPLVGLVLGRSLAGELGSVATPVAGALLGLVGAYSLANGVRSGRSNADPLEVSFGRLLLIGAILSIDNLVIGFALGAYNVSLVVAAVTIGGISVALSLLGLEAGQRLGDRLGSWSELVGGGVLILVGVGIGVGLI
jgi:putative Mn2+ efflux pump MntP